MEGIPTMYHGRRFRSRLEARWAAMFDFLSWQYEYEPYDLNGWIPDFVLFGAEEIIVEVKPYRLLGEFDTGKIFAALKGTKKWGKEILLLGATIWESDPYVVFGYLGEYGELWANGERKMQYWFGPAVLNCYKGWGFYHQDACWKDRITGLYDGDAYLRYPNYEDVLKLWNQAGNIVQWRAEE